MDTRLCKAKTIAVLSGKGGTGKTLISVNLACAAGSSVYMDCDAEEPNGHLFFKPRDVSSQKVYVPVPQVDPALCDGCRECVDFCAFHALAWAGGKLLVFDELCHGCGGCMMVCPKGALTETKRKIGEIQHGMSQGISVHSGFLDPGEASGVPIIKALLEQAKDIEESTLIIDCPPGSSCLVSESIRDADYCLLVAEPTRFGAHNLEMVHALVRLYGKPCGVVLNKCLPGRDPSEEYCLRHGIPILARIPFDEKLGLLNANGKIAVREDAQYQTIFVRLLEEIDRETAHAAVGHS